jgi:hypothetical protein
LLVQAQRGFWSYLGQEFWFWLFLLLGQTCKGFKEEFWVLLGFQHFFWVGEIGCYNFVVCCLIGKGSWKGKRFVFRVGDCWSNCFHVQFFG